MSKKQFKMTPEERRTRTFSDGFKIKKVRELEAKKVRRRDLIREYEITQSTISRWIEKFGSMKNKKERVVVESESDTAELAKLRKRLAELERTVGQKQLLIDFQAKMIEIAEETYGVDIKKKFTDLPSDTSPTTD
jgi:transposase